jgi:hypothetical protein
MSKLISPLEALRQSGEINFEIEEKDEALDALARPSTPTTGPRSTSSTA